MLGCDPGSLRDLAGKFDRASQRVGAALGDVQHEVNRLPWFGGDAEDMRRAVSTLGQTTGADICARLSRMAASLRTNADAQDGVSRVLGGRGNGAPVSSAGGPKAKRQVPAYLSTAELDVRIAALDAQISELENDLSDDSSGSDFWDGVGGKNPFGRSKRETLDDLKKARRALDDMRGTDGRKRRDAKSIASLKKRIASLEKDIKNDGLGSKISEGIGDANPMARSKQETLGDLKKALRALEHTTYNERRIMEVKVGDNGEDFRVVEAYGDLANADRVVIHVPGMNTGSESYDAEGNADAIRLQEELNRQARPGEKVVVISWADYDIPKGVQEASMPGRAVDGGKALSDFTQSLEKMGFSPDKISVVAHSYGSTTAGAAMKHGMSVANVTVLGSPGMLAIKRSDLGSLTTDVWVGEAARDIVADSAQFGTDPSFDSFGAKQFETTGSSGHSEYYDRGSTSLTNIARVSIDKNPIK